MRKLLAFLLAAMMLFSVVGCAGAAEEEEATTVGGILLNDFKADAEGSAQEIAERLSANEVIPFEATTMAVEPGWLMGFDAEEITGFKDGVMFAPMIGTIPFVGYVFELEDGADVDAFIETLTSSANLCWNICTEAEEMTVDSEGNKVFFLMSPMTFEESAE